MKYKKWSLDQKLEILSVSEEIGIVESCRKYGVSTGTFYSWKKKFEHQGEAGLKVDFANKKSLLWQREIANVITVKESELTKKHLIAQNYTNFKAPIPVVDANISIVNFHYAWPEAVQWNYHFDKIIGFDESGFSGTGDRVYRRQAWQFMLSGGGLFNNLDYSFFVGFEDSQD